MTTFSNFLHDWRFWLALVIVLAVVFWPKRKAPAPQPNWWEETLFHVQRAQMEEWEWDWKTLRYVKGLQDSLRFSKITLDLAISQGTVPTQILPKIRAEHARLEGVLQQWERDRVAFVKAHPYPRPASAEVRTLREELLRTPRPLDTD